MTYQIIKLCIYIISIGIAMYGLTCFNFDGVVKKTKIKEFYAFYFIASISLGYLFASFVFEFMTVQF
ncbi:MAG: DUF1146 domain-containing protein [Coprobacillaceae bacterium]